MHPSLLSAKRQLDDVEVAFKNGVLTVTVPKSAEAKNVRRIAINRNG